MSTDENHREAPMMLTVHKICRIFDTSFHFGPPTYFISRCCGRALHAVFYRRHFSLKIKKNKIIIKKKKQRIAV